MVLTSKNWPMPLSFLPLADETPEGRSVVVLAKEQFGIRGRSLQDKECSLFHLPP